MSGFLYFVPGPPRTAFSQDDLVKLGLGHVFERGAGTTCREYRGTGPGDQQGGTVLIVSDTLSPDRHAYVAEKQTWRKIPKSECWVGYWNDGRPGPADLARNSPVSGHLVRLADGNLWLVPVARGMSESADGQPEFYQNVDRVIEQLDNRISAAIPLPLRPYRALWISVPLRSIHAPSWITRRPYQCTSSPEKGRKRLARDPNFFF